MNQEPKAIKAREDIEAVSKLIVADLAAGVTHKVIALKLNGLGWRMPDMSKVEKSDCRNIISHGWNPERFVRRKPYIRSNAKCYQPGREEADKVAAAFLAPPLLAPATTKPGSADQKLQWIKATLAMEFMAPLDRIAAVQAVLGA